MICLEKKRGLIPNAEFYDNAFGRWNPLSVISISIGQGEINLTPLQIANLGAIIANRGYYYAPHVVRKIQGVQLKQKYLKRHKVMGTPQAFNEVVAGMVSSAHGGNFVLMQYILDIHWQEKLELRKIVVKTTLFLWDLLL